MRAHFHNSLFSWGALALLSITIICLTLFKGPDRIMIYDVFNSYLYLPATFKHADPGIEDEQWLNEIIEKYDYHKEFYPSPRSYKNRHVIKYTSGMAILMSPFYFVGDAIAEPLGYPADGFSPPYHWVMKFCGLLYALIGLFFLRAVLRKIYSDKVTAAILVIIIVGTNYLIFSLTNSMMQHIPLFSLYAILIWLTQKWHEKPQRSKFILIAATCGIITLIRPTDILCLLIPVLWQVQNWRTLRDKIINLWQNHQVDLVLFIVVFASFGLPQMVYWKFTADSLFFVSYQDASEGLSLFNPWTWQVLFSFENGWLIYSPLMLLGFTGLYFLRKNYAELFWPVIAFTVLNVWLVSSWSHWNYAGGFGHRAMIQSYPVWALAIGASLNWLITKKPIVRLIASAVIVLFLFLSLFQQWQFYHAILPMERITSKFYFAVFGKTTKDPEDAQLLLINRNFDGPEILLNEEDYIKDTLFLQTFEEFLEIQHVQVLETEKGINSVLRMDSTLQFSEGVKIPYQDLTHRDHAWIRAEVMVYLFEGSSIDDLYLVATFEHKGDLYHYKAQTVDTGVNTTGSWQQVQFDYLTPKVRSKKDQLAVYVWYRGKNAALIDDLKIFRFIEKER